MWPPRSLRRALYNVAGAALLLLVCQVMYRRYERWLQTRQRLIDMPRAADPPDDREPRHRDARPPVDDVCKELADGSVVIFDPEPTSLVGNITVTDAWIHSTNAEDLVDNR